MATNKDFGFEPMKPEALVRYRKQTKRTQNEFAAAFHISPGGLQKYEQGKRPIPEHLRHAIKMERKLLKLEAAE